ncbi:malate synthase G [Vibrio casei]|uniref:Malate synthase G n=1 Tax=Vibrio casei TaxID=673372 RepID=A0A368LK65_9VIBR|nr:malate synthase G [Vibrio casei]SJN29949.1 Malate synthase G [Vibrio casei]HBV77970.1 malate synthase G [Vibrio sp.]
MNLAQTINSKITPSIAHKINAGLVQFVNQDVLPLTRLNQEIFWQEFSQLLTDLTPKNQALLEKREIFQQKIDDWHQANPQCSANQYQTFLQEIGYLVEQGDDFQINTQHVDQEIAMMAGPQLVVPIKNARFALNAANARWGSLYDAAYGSDVIPQCEGLKAGKKYNPARGNHVIAFGKTFLDENFPLKEGSHHDVQSYSVYFHHLLATFPDGSQSGLAQPCQFVASSNPDVEPTSIVLKNNGLHIELIINRKGNIGKTDIAGLDDIQIESALSTIMDFEDSIAAVDSQDKLEAYRNWFGLITGNLTATINKGNQTQIRRLNCDRSYTHKNGDDYNLHGRSLLMVRNVGHLMTSDLVQDAQGNNLPEGLIDAVITALIASIEIKNPQACRVTNSRTGSIYIVKPKMHGPEEVAFSNEIFERVESMLDLTPNTIKMGIMDEERRTTVNLKECIRAAQSRVVFINTGFLDRTGDEIHTSMQAGAFKPKAEIKHQAWISAYENNNVEVGLACGFAGKAQIGKGMWAMPEEMKAMMSAKVAHPQSGANTAWVPSPTAATLHAIHYHQVNVFEQQQAIANRTPAKLEDLLKLELLDENELTEQQVEAELDNNIQGILGYVVRWVEMGIGCSKVPDINNIELMEDRATLRISSQHIANWLLHGICRPEQVMDSMHKMAQVVDNQNQSSEGYKAMQPNTEQSLAFQAARELIFQGRNQPSGYTEPLLHQYRIWAKNQ